MGVCRGGGRMSIKSLGLVLAGFLVSRGFFEAMIFLFADAERGRGWFSCFQQRPVCMQSFACAQTIACRVLQRPALPAHKRKTRFKRRKRPEIADRRAWHAGCRRIGPPYLRHNKGGCFSQEFQRL